MLTVGVADNNILNALIKKIRGIKGVKDASR